MASSVGLELGTSAVRAVLLDPRTKPPRLLAAAHAPWGGADLLRAIQHVRRTLPIKSPVVLGLPTTSAIVTTVQPLVVNHARANLAVGFELQQHLPYDASQTVWHYQWLSLNGPSKSSAPSSGGAGGAAVVAAVKHSVLQERLTACQRAGVAVRGVQVNAVAVANAWLQSAGLHNTVPGLVVRLDGRALEWIIMVSNGLYVFPSLLPTADQDQLVTWLKSSWEGLQKHLETCAVTLPAAPSVWLVGRAESQPSFGASLQRAIECSVQSLSLETIVRPTTSVPTAVGTAVGAEDFVATCGLALQAAGTTRLSLNLVGQILRARRVARLRRSCQLIGLVAALVAVGWSAQGILASLRSREAVVDAYRKEEQSYQLLRPEVRTIRKHQARLEQRLAQLESLARTHDRMTRSFIQITETLPDSLWLTMLDLTKSFPHINGTLEGFAQSFQGVTQFIDRLKAEPEWVTVKPQATNVMTDPTTRTEVVAFAIQVQRLLGASSTAPSAAEDSATAKSTKKKKK